MCFIICANWDCSNRFVILVIFVVLVGFHEAYLGLFLDRFSRGLVVFFKSAHIFLFLST